MQRLVLRAPLTSLRARQFALRGGQRGAGGLQFGFDAQGAVAFGVQRLLQLLYRLRAVEQAVAHGLGCGLRFVHALAQPAGDGREEKDAVFGHAVGGSWCRVDGFGHGGRRLWWWWVGPGHQSRPVSASTNSTSSTSPSAPLGP